MDINTALSNVQTITIFDILVMIEAINNKKTILEYFQNIEQKYFIPDYYVISSYYLKNRKEICKTFFRLQNAKENIEILIDHQKMKEDYLIVKFFKTDLCHLSKCIDKFIDYKLSIFMIHYSLFYFDDSKKKYIQIYELEFIDEQDICLIKKENKYCLVYTKNIIRIPKQYEHYIHIIEELKETEESPLIAHYLRPENGTFIDIFSLDSKTINDTKFIYEQNQKIVKIKNGDFILENNEHLPILWLDIGYWTKFQEIPQDLS